jgi:large subunit ribosomal protein L6
MSRIGKKPVDLPANVKVAVAGGEVKVEGPKGKLAWRPHRLMAVKVAGTQVIVERADETRESRALHGLTRALVQNMVTGVSTGFERKLIIEGVGYRAELKGKSLNMSLGFSHQVDFPLPDGVTAEVVDRTQVTLRGINKQLIGETAAKIRAIRPPEPYGGKGIRYGDEVIKMKEGKSGGK